LFAGNPKHYFPNNTYESKTQRTFQRHLSLLRKKGKGSAGIYLTENPHNTVFPAVGAGGDDPDDLSTGELEGVYEGIPVGISTFKNLCQLRTLQILQHLVSWHYDRLTSSEQADWNPPSQPHSSSRTPPQASTTLFQSLKGR